MNYQYLKRARTRHIGTGLNLKLDTRSTLDVGAQIPKVNTNGQTKYLL